MNENEMNDEELEAHEKKTAIEEDKWDRLELFRRVLDESRLEMMYTLKRSTKLGPECPYYKLAMRKFREDQEREIVRLLQELIEQDFSHE